ncbi:mechanosensitive ion channel domain-containing protein [Neorhizobium sp. NPDC001467]|uniref:mechanosensitive ion channel domain-containing protein n=1 Tax=Neorhizobium sp. NPDC001467 TaxID=3390595 RepID=UPI003D0182CB
MSETKTKKTGIGRIAAAAMIALLIAVAPGPLSSAGHAEDVPAGAGHAQAAPGQTAPSQTPPAQNPPAQAPANPPQGSQPASSQPDQNGQAAPADSGVAQVTADSINANVRANLAGIRSQLDAFRERVQRDSDDDGSLAELRVRAEEITAAMQETSARLKERETQIQERLTALGEAPKQGQPGEPPLVSQERGRLMNERAELNVVAENAASLSDSANQLGNTITNLRRNLFTRTLFRHTDMSSDLFIEAGQATKREVSNFARTISGWAGFVWNYKKYQLLGALVLSLGAGLLFLLGGYRVFARLIHRRVVGGEAPSYLRRLSVAFWSTVVETMSLAAFLICSYLFLDGFNVLRSDVSAMVASFFGFVWFIYFVWNLTSSVLAPADPDWRLVRITNRGARLLSLAVIAMAVVNGLDYLLGSVSEALNSPLIVTIAKSIIAAFVIGLIMIGLSFVKPIIAAGETADAQGHPWPRAARILLRLAGLLLILSVIAGYVGFARFVATQVVLTGAVTVLIYIGLLSGKAVSKQGAFKKTAAGTKLAERFKFGDVGLDQTGLLAGLSIYAFALVFGIPLILLTWGFQLTDIESWVYQFFTRITIGNISISIVSIFGGVLLFAAGYVVTGWIQKWIDGNVMARGQVDMGVRNSVRTGIGYLGVGLAALIGISAAGIDLSSFALVASALSVGIGFGLQNIVSNFVSGLILLVERPFKVGDHVITGATEGIVKRISVRATEIETFRKQSIIVPNSELINAPLGNWTHRNRIQRNEIPVSASYDADPHQVIEILLDLVKEVPEILRTPEPHVEFLRFAPSSLDFELRFHLADMDAGLRIRNQLRADILKAFRRAGIDIPFPQQEIVLHRGKPNWVPEKEEDPRGGA